MEVLFTSDVSVEVVSAAEVLVDVSTAGLSGAEDPVVASSVADAAVALLSADEVSFVESPEGPPAANFFGDEGFEAEEVSVEVL